MPIALSLLALAAAPLASVAAGAQDAANAPLLVYPAMRHSGGVYVVGGPPGEPLRVCLPAEPAAGGDGAAACAALRAGGLPAGLEPAVAAGDPAAWIPLSDFPAAAARAAQGRSLALIFQVDASGRVADCRAYRSSGDAAVDRFACASMIARARFRPASYKGQAVPAAGVKPVRFPGG